MPKESRSSRKPSPARTRDRRESQLINMAMDLVERKLLDGTATSQETVHFLRLGTRQAKLENEKLRMDLEVAKAKIKAMESQEDLKDIYEQAMRAMKSYTGNYDEEYEDEEYYDEDY